ncbi:MAG: nitrophenyl compound nitroreductase subunit ArsF family protein [Planctomycetes bacterium]|jgi:hypothetical protein|nr:nitrophenyl compound nitroreductase subunit ArsF family protein [Planctomycetota bacterium]
MKKIVISLLFLSLTVVLAGCENATSATGENAVAGDQPMSSAKLAEDRLEVFYFHSTNRCVSCLTIGRYVKETMEQRFPEQLKSGLIDYREINVDLPENKETAKKFKATGSSLYINRIIDGQDNIEFYADVWRNFGNEARLKNQLAEKISAYLDN